MAKIIRQDTVWEGVVNLTDDVQVAQGATLTIRAGTTINGNGHELDIFGIVNFEGKRNSHVSVKEVNIGGSGELDMNFVKMIRGSLMELGSNSHALTFDVSNSSFTNLHWNVEFGIGSQTTNALRGCVFDGVYLNPHGNVTISDNIFRNYLGSDGGSAGDILPLVMVRADNDNTDFSDNVILGSSGILLEVYYRGSITGTGNYFEGIPLSKVHKILWDNRDDLNAPSKIKIGAVEKPQADNFFYQVGTGQDDVLKGTSMEDTLFGARGADMLSGQKGNDELFGNGGTDKIYGGPGNDFVSGGNGNDEIAGEFGHDLLIGGKGNDLLSGGAGKDKFVFRYGNGTDTIQDWNDGRDKIVFESGARSLAGLTITQDGDDVRIAYNHGNIILEDTPLSEIGANDFIFL